MYSGRVLGPKGRHRLRGLFEGLLRTHDAYARWRSRAGRRRRPGREWWSDEPRWFPGGTPPRQHNRVTPLVDGESFFAQLREELSGAQRYVFIIGWCLTPDIPLSRREPADLVRTRLLDLLNETAQRVPVRVLLWAGAPFLLQPTTGTMRSVQREMSERCKGDLRCELDRTARLSHCHHQKAIVVDGRVAFVGGMDLTTYQGDRWDTHGHPLRVGVNWHDVQVRVEGEAVADVEVNFRQRWEGATGQSDLPPPAPPEEVPRDSWQTPVQVVRTIPRHTYDFARHGEFGIFHAYIETLRRARRLIYLENQYLWSPEVVDALIESIGRSRDGALRVVILLPARAYDGRWDNDKHVAALRRADGGRGVVSVYSPWASGVSSGSRAFTYRPVYVHAKVGIVDDEWLLIGSANLNRRGLVTDSEIDVLVHDPEVARSLRVELWAEHLNLPREEVETAGVPAMVEAWASRAARSEQILSRGEEPLECSACPYEVGRSLEDWMLEDLESLTLEH